MTPIRLSPLQHAISLAGALAIAVSLFAGAAATAQTSNSGAYRAELAQPAASPQILSSGVLWRCDGTTCIAARATSRPAIICARLVRETGPLTSFMVNGQALTAEQLARCNAVTN
jgi:hypothetical protein